MPIRPALPLAPTEYDKSYMDTLVRVLNIYFTQLDQPYDAIYNKLRLLNLPTSSSGLPVGTLYNDGGTVKVVE